jgi:hypothetical protein
VDEDELTLDLGKKKKKKKKDAAADAGVRACCMPTSLWLLLLALHGVLAATAPAMESRRQQHQSSLFLAAHFLCDVGCLRLSPLLKHGISNQAAFFFRGRLLVCP